MKTFNETLPSIGVLSANRNSAAVPLKNMFMYSLAFIVSGTPTGTVKLQVSNDPETNDVSQPIQPAVSNWIDLANSSFTLSAAGETMWNVQYTAYNYVRVAYTDTSGGTSTATVKIIFNGKG